MHNTIEDKDAFDGLAMVHRTSLTVLMPTPSALVRLDNSAAFDMVNHATLLTRLEKDFGIIDQVLQWISSYLYSKSFQVLVGSLSSLSFRARRASFRGRC